MPLDISGQMLFRKVGKMADLVPGDTRDLVFVSGVLAIASDLETGEAEMHTVSGSFLVTMRTTNLYLSYRFKPPVDVSGLDANQVLCGDVFKLLKGAEDENRGK